MISRRQRILFLVPFIVIVVPFMIFPALLGLFASFTNYAPFSRTPIHFVGLANYNQILTDHDFRQSILNILVFTAVTVSLELVIGILIAYRLRKAFRGRSLLRFVLLLPWLISPVANGVMWRFLLQSNAGIFDYWGELLRLPATPALLGSGLALPSMMAVDLWRKVPLVMFLVLPGLQFVPQVFWDLAELEGMSLYYRLRHIILPHLRLLLLTITMLLIGDAFGASESILILTGGGPGSETMTPGLYSYNQAISVFNWVGGATSAWLIAAAILMVGIIYVLLARREVI